MKSKSLYLRIYQDVYNSIIMSSEYTENSALPSERYLCEKYHVSRSTIRRALEKLKEDGYIYTVRGNGSFKKPQVFEQNLTKFYSFTDELKNSNIIIQNQIIEYQLIQLDKVLAARLGYAAGSYFHKLVRLRLAKDYPLMLETTYLPQSRFYKVNPEVLRADVSLYGYLKKNYNFCVEYAIEMFHAKSANAKEQKLLQIISNTPCIFLERFSYEDGIISEYTQSVVRGDKYIFKVQLLNSYTNN